MRSTVSSVPLVTILRTFKDEEAERLAASAHIFVCRRSQEWMPINQIRIGDSLYERLYFHHNMWGNLVTDESMILIMVSS